MAVYECFKCKNPYGGGLRECEDRDIKHEELLCQKCKNAKVNKNNLKGYDVFTQWEDHGNDSLLYKCRFWCSIATFFWWGETHFCDSCHRRQENSEGMDEKKPEELPQWNGKDNWPLNINHPLNGTEDYAIKWMLWPD